MLTAVLYLQAFILNVVHRRHIIHMYVKQYTCSTRVKPKSYSTPTPNSDTESGRRYLQYIAPSKLAVAHSNMSHASSAHSEMAPRRDDCMLGCNMLVGEYNRVLNITMEYYAVSGISMYLPAIKPPPRKDRLDQAALG